MSKDSTSVTSSLAWSLFEQGGSKAVSLIVQIVLARLLLPEMFGVLAVMLVFIDVANSISQSGLGSALVQRQDITPKDCSTGLWLSLLISAVVYVVIFICAPLISSFYGFEGLDVYLRVLALAVPINAFNSIQRSLLQRDMRFKALFWVNLSSVVLSGVLGITFAVLGFGVWALIGQSLCQCIVACVVMAWHSSWKARAEFDVRVAWELFSFGWKICVTGILNVIYTGVSELILGKACGSYDLGLYNQGRKWPNAANGVFYNATQNVFFPAFSKLQGQPEKLRAQIRKALAGGTYLAAPFGFLLAACAEPLVAVILSEKWLGCVFVFQMASVTACLMMIQVVNLRAYMALGDSGLYLKLQVIKVVVSCLAIWPVALLTGDINLTAATVAACSFVCALLVDLHPAKRVHGVGAVEQIRMLLPSVVIAMFVGVLTWTATLTSLPYAAMLAVQLPLYCVIYIAVTKIASVPGLSEVSSVAKALVERAAR